MSLRLNISVNYRTLSGGGANEPNRAALERPL